MLPRSRAGEKVGRATFSRKTQWFQHTFPLRPESGPAGSREILGGSRGPLDVPPGVSGGAPRAPSGVLLPGSFLQDAYSEIPLQVILLGDFSCRIPSQGCLSLGFLFGISFPWFLIHDSCTRFHSGVLRNCCLYQLFGVSRWSNICVYDVYTCTYSYWIVN